MLKGNGLFISIFLIKRRHLFDFPSQINLKSDFSYFINKKEKSRTAQVALMVKNPPANAGDA